MITNVIPQIGSIFSELGGELPATTRFLLSLSDIFKSYGIIIIVIIIAAVYGFRRVLKKNKDVRYHWHSLLLKIPVFGKLMMKINIARFTRTLSSLLSSGVAVIESLDISADTLNNEVFKKDIKDAAKKVEDGSSLSEQLKKSEHFPKMVPYMISVGEETGTLDKTLDKVNNFYEKEVDHSVKNLSSILEPILMVIIGLGAGFIIISVITPIYQMSTLF